MTQKGGELIMKILPSTIKKKTKGKTLKISSHLHKNRMENKCE